MIVLTCRRCARMTKHYPLSNESTVACGCGAQRSRHERGADGYHSRLPASAWARARELMEFDPQLTGTDLCHQLRFEGWTLGLSAARRMRKKVTA